VSRSTFTRAARLICAALLLASVAVQSGRAAGPEKFKPFKMKTPAGQEKTLADMLGGKTTLVSFFFPGCPFCNAEFPAVQKMYDTYKDRGLSMVWINVVSEQNKQVTPWLTQHGYTVPVLLGGEGAQGTYKLLETPTHFLLDAQGNIRWTHHGYKPGDETELETQIQRALE
jgi:thiol-disulfide isomerase/thioredoxin